MLSDGSHLQAAHHYLDSQMKEQIQLIKHLQDYQVQLLDYAYETYYYPDKDRLEVKLLVKEYLIVSSQETVSAAAT